LESCRSRCVDGEIAECGQAQVVKAREQLVDSLHKLLSTASAQSGDLHSVGPRYVDMVQRAHATEFILDIFDQYNFDDFLHESVTSCHGQCHR
jgi:hypothetical protein